MLTRRSFFKFLPALAVQASVENKPATEPSGEPPIVEKAGDKARYPVGTLIEYVRGYKAIVTDVSDSNDSIPPRYAVHHVDRLPRETNTWGHPLFDKGKTAWWEAREWHRVLRLGPG